MHLQRFTKKVTTVIALTLVGSFCVQISPSRANDPFRCATGVTCPFDTVGEDTDRAFQMMFKLGDYQGVRAQLDRAAITDGEEPLVYALKGAMAYLDQDFSSLYNYALNTQTKAQALDSDDPLRSNLYLAIGHFLEGAYLLKKDGVIGALPKLQQVLSHFDKAEQYGSSDQELNLIQGYMELFLAVNLPFSSPEDAINNFASSAGPSYLVNRGIAVAYKNLGDLEQATNYVDAALAETPDNPEVHYLKAQIMRRTGQYLYDQGQAQQALPYLQAAMASFNKALTMKEKMNPKELASLSREAESTDKLIGDLL